MKKTNMRKGREFPMQRHFNKFAVIVKATSFVESVPFFPRCVTTLARSGLVHRTGGKHRPGPTPRAGSRAGNR